MLIWILCLKTGVVSTHDIRCLDCEFLRFFMNQFFSDLFISNTSNRYNLFFLKEILKIAIQTRILVTWTFFGLSLVHNSRSLIFYCTNPVPPTIALTLDWRMDAYWSIIYLWCNTCYKPSILVEDYLEYYHYIFMWCNVWEIL